MIKQNRNNETRPCECIVGTIDFNSMKTAGTLDLTVIPAKALITDMFLVVKEQFDGSAKATVGIVGDDDRYFNDVTLTAVIPNTIGTLEKSKVFIGTTGLNEITDDITIITLKHTGAPTKGVLQVIVKFSMLNTFTGMSI